MLLTCSGDEHISFTTSKIGSLVDVNQSRDPDGLRLAFLFFKTALENLPILLRDAPDIDFFGYTENRMPDIRPDVLCHRMSFVTGYLESFEFVISPSSNCFLIKKNVSLHFPLNYIFFSVLKKPSILAASFWSLVLNDQAAYFAFSPNYFYLLVNIIFLSLFINAMF